jgi:hypothetical protein
MHKTFFEFDLGIFPSKIFVAIGYDSIYDIIDLMGIDEDDFEPEYDPDECDYLAYTYFLSDSGNCCLFFNKQFSNLSDLSILVHEISHCAFLIMKFYDTPLSSDTTEAFAYMQHYIFRKVIEHYRINKDGKLCIKHEKGKK